MDGSDLQRSTKTIFLDRDGVINVNRDDRVKQWSEFAFLPGSLAALRLLHQAGFHVFVVTNQAIISRGIVTAATVDDIHSRMCATVAHHGGQITAVHYCPHAPPDYCSCRKPKPGLLLDLAHHWQLDLAQTLIVGDSLSDIAAAHAASCRGGVLVRTGHGSAQAALVATQPRPPLHVADDLLAAVAWVLAHGSGV